MAFHHHCCRSGGSNLNAGTRTGNSTEPGTAADFSYASGTWVAATGVFTVASGNPLTDGVAVGDMASVYADGSTETGFIGAVTARTATTITVSLAQRMGSPPTDGTNTRSLKIGGAWQGPNGAVVFPFNLARISEVAVGSNRIQINLKNNQTYSVSANMNPDSNTHACRLRGYTSSYADGGRATVDGGTSGASYVVFSGARAWYFYDLVFQNNGATGSANMIANGGFFVGCVFRDSRGAGTSGAAYLKKCEVFGCNQSNTANTGGALNPAYVFDCMIHDNTGSNNDGISMSAGTLIVVDTICESNGRNGIRMGSTLVMDNCDTYNNGSDGVSTVAGSGTAAAYVTNSNFIKNGGYGLNSVGIHIVGSIINCGFGSGTQANASGTLSSHWQIGVSEVGTVTYAVNVTPWVDPANGDFRINLAAAKGVGDGAYLQTASSYAGTVGYPDIGAAQHLDSGGTSKPAHPLFQQVIG